MEEIKEENIKEKEKKKFSFKSLLIKIVVVITLLVLYSLYIGNMGLFVNDYGIYNEKVPESFVGVKIVQLSDIHYSSVGYKKMDSIISKINDIKPDIVLFTGDLYDNYSIVTEDNINELKELLSKINTNLGKYAIRGNHDYDYEYYDDIINNSGFTLLDSNSVLLYNNSDNPIEIIGWPNYDPNYDIELSDNFKIAMIHEPDNYDNIIDKDIDLVVAGHSHGGQVRLPYIGSIFNNRGAKKYTGRYYKHNNTDFYISYGIGNSMYNFRLFNHPSINLYRLYNK